MPFLEPVLYYMSYQGRKEEDVLLVPDDVLDEYIKQRLYEVSIPSFFKLSSKKEKEIPAKTLAEFEKEF